MPGFQPSRTRLVFELAAPIAHQSWTADVLAMANLDHDNYSIVILNLVNDPVGALAKSVALLIGEFFASIRTGILGEHLDSL